MTQSPPTVSVLVTVYNRERFLEQTLRSIGASSFSDFEVVVVDDCSADGSLRIAERVAAEDRRIRVVRNEWNLGDYGNRMKAASLARGEFLKYVDSDDLIYPHSLGVMVEAMGRDSEIALAVSHSMPEDQEPYPWILTPAESYRKHFLGRGCLSCGPTGAIIRKAAFERAGGFRKEWGVLSDVDLWLRISARWHVGLLPPGLVWWRRHEGQEFVTGNAHMVYLERGFELAVAALSAEACPLSPADRRAALLRVRQHHARRLLSLASRGKSPRMALRMIRRSGLSLRELISGLQKYVDG